MNTQPQKQIEPVAACEEQILVIKRTTLFSPENPAWHGIENNNTDLYVQMIHKHQEYQPRSLMEQDPTYKQIIPYMIFTHQNRFFVMQRKSTTSEQRLKNLYSLGIGGHVQQEDVVGLNLMDWARREFHEEVLYEGNLRVTTLGILNDDSNEVGRVHLGLVLLLEGNSSDISIKSELKSGQLLTMAECKTYYDQLESWSKLVLNFLMEQYGPSHDTF